MTDYTILFFYVILGFVGVVFHWWKKHYIDLTTNDTLQEYLFHDLKSTFNAVCTIIGSEITLTISNSADAWSLGAVSGAFAVGYTLDSFFNRSSDHNIKPR